jgi:hypothetical protein
MKNNNLTYVARQGDVNIFRVEEMPENLKPIEGKVLQQSETTGHHHHFKKDAPVRLFEEGTVNKSNTITPDTGKYFVVDEDTLLYHGKGFEPMPSKTKTGDHDAINLPAGNYKIVITQEFDYSTRTARRVID